MNGRSQSSATDFEILISTLRAEGHEQAARKLDELLHEVAWTSSSEMVGELGLEVVRFQRGNPRVSPELQELLHRCLKQIKRVWPGIENARAYDAGAMFSVCRAFISPRCMEFRDVCPLFTKDYVMKNKRESLSRGRIPRRTSPFVLIPRDSEVMRQA